MLEESNLKYQGDQTLDETRKGGLRAKIKPVYLLGFVVWVAVVAVAVLAIQYKPEAEPRGSLSLGAADAPVTVMEFSDFQ